ncbi:MAG TPA: DNA/RNA non-specific endonuclease, partial [Verrucomicrobiae bacterium]|nr:DNA/RNA non-specific endonuclease [Verrucomicrobiae bacterium]
NAGVWETFEEYCRSQDTNYEVLITAGPSGFGTRTIPSGKAYIPSNVWKIAVFVPAGTNSVLSRISATNRVIAISVPNVTNGLSSTWQTYVTSPQKIEQDTGLRFFTALTPDVASVFRAEVDGTPYFTGISFSSNQFQFVVNCWPAGTNYIVQTSTNLTTANWISLRTNVAPFQFTDTNFLPQRFYRVKSSD